MSKDISLKNPFLEKGNNKSIISYNCIFKNYITFDFSCYEP